MSFKMPIYVGGGILQYKLYRDNDNPMDFTKESLLASENNFPKLFRKARFITFSDSIDKFGETVIKHHGDVAGSPILDLPFEVCIFDVANTGVITMASSADGEQSAMVSLLVHEIEPGIYEYYSMEMLNIDGQIDPVPKVFHIPSHTSEDVIFDYHFITRAMVDQLKSTDTALGTIKTKHSVRVGKGKDRRGHKIREVIFVIPKQRRSESRAIVGVDVDWTHRWEVRGHWRKIVGIGKNRAGQYGTKGLTWVLPHVKGPDDKPVVRKQRVVQIANTTEG